ncbi:mitochondrial ribosome-associated GTPase 1 isoform X2 [Chroicocephalus ridibundus]|uniref:mitochondrial ribosome-associated GTPase 1 isoform X2 n=1 Tax=Chroicocephalus ridibundus TaxID=1192867 RepID=UPI002FDD3FAE
MRGWVGALRAAAVGPGSVPGAFRQRFDFGGRDVASWFPGHMAKGLRQMRASLRRADCLIEVHDARISSGTALHSSLGQQEPTPCHLHRVPPPQLLRFPPGRPFSRSRTPLQLCTSPINSHRPPPRYLLPRQCTIILLSSAHIPLSGRNPMLREVLGIRPHVLVLNKRDLADPQRKPIVPLVAKLVDNSPRYHRAESTEYSILVIGVPNVGKSSLINSLRRLHLKKGKATAVGGEPGVTKAVLTRIQVCEKPLMYLVDTPGVLPPKLEDVETGVKLALCGAIRDHLVGEDIMADYLLYTLNKQQQFGYVQRYGLAEACDAIEPVLRRVALTRGRTQKVKVLTGTGNVNVTTLDYSAAAYEFLRDFRAGCLGRVTLD